MKENGVDMTLWILVGICIIRTVGSIDIIAVRTASILLSNNTIIIQTAPFVTSPHGARPCKRIIAATAVTLASIVAAVAVGVPAVTLASIVAAVAVGVPAVTLASIVAAMAVGVPAVTLASIVAAMAVGVPAVTLASILLSNNTIIIQTTPFVTSPHGARPCKRIIAATAVTLASTVAAVAIRVTAVTLASTVAAVAIRVTAVTLASILLSNNTIIIQTAPFMTSPHRARPRKRIIATAVVTLASTVAAAVTIDVGVVALLSPLAVVCGGRTIIA